MASLRNLRKKFAARPTCSIELDDSSDSDCSESSEISLTQSPTRSTSPSDLQPRTNGTSGTSLIRVNAKTFGKLPPRGTREFTVQLAVNIHLASKRPKAPPPGTKEYETKLDDSISRAKKKLAADLAKRRKIVCLD